MLLALALLPLAAASPTLGGATGLLTVPNADVQAEGTVAFGASRHNPSPARLEDVENYTLLVGFLPGLELAGRIAEGDFDAGSSIRDLSFNAKYRLWGAEDGPGLAIGALDIGGEAQNFRGTYAVATLPWKTLSLSLGYGWGPDVLEGALGGLEWRPWRALSLMGEYDTEFWNGGVRVESPAMFGGLRVGATAAYRAEIEDVEFGASVSVPLGRRAVAVPVRVETTVGGATVGGALAPTIAAEAAPTEDLPQAPTESRPRPLLQGPTVRVALTDLGFESVRIGVRDAEAPVLVVTLENRRYNHSSADAIGLALGVIAAHADPDIERIELTLSTYGVPQLTVSAPASLARGFFADPAGVGPALRQALRAWPSGGVDASQVRWDGAPTAPLQAVELVMEPVLRTFVATEYGVLDYGLALRGRLTVPMARGLLAHLGLQAAVAESDDFRGAGNFAPFMPESGLSQALLQYLHKPAPQWLWLWSAGRTQIPSANLDTVALEQAWISRDGAHTWRVKAMAMRGRSSSAEIALAGYSWFDPARDYSVALTGGRFYAGDAGVRLELNRHFGDTILGVFFKAASMDDQAGGLQVSLPLTPRQDAQPRGLQVKGARRWAHSVSSTLNASDQRNPLMPLLLYEPMLDLDLQRDLLDAGRLGEDYLRDELPRMREAYERWGIRRGDGAP